MKKFFKEFKEFALKGNVLDMAVGVIIGGAFTAIVTALTENFIDPIIQFVFHIPGWIKGLFAGGKWNYYSFDQIGTFCANFVSAVFNFLIIAFVLFLIVKGINKLLTAGKKEEPEAAPTTKICPYCKSEISIEATRCPHCTSEIKD